MAMLIDDPLTAAAVSQRLLQPMSQPAQIQNKLFLQIVRLEACSALLSASSLPKSVLKCTVSIIWPSHSIFVRL